MDNVTALFGMPGLTVLAAARVAGEWEVLVETAQELTGCAQCGAVARVNDRAVTVRDLPIAGTPVVVCWYKRVWECRHALCPNKTWTEQHPEFASRAVLSERARRWAFEQVGRADAGHRRLPRRAGPDGRVCPPRPGYRPRCRGKVITTAKTYPVPEIARLGRTLAVWRTEFLARFDHPDVSNGPTENLSLNLKNTKRAARGYRSLHNYRLRLLLNHGLISDDQATTRIRTRTPRLVA